MPGSGSGALRILGHASGTGAGGAEAAAAAAPLPTLASPPRRHLTRMGRTGGPRRVEAEAAPIALAPLSVALTPPGCSRLTGWAAPPSLGAGLGMHDFEDVAWTEEERRVDERLEEEAAAAAAATTAPLLVAIRAARAQQAAVEAELAVDRHFVARPPPASSSPRPASSPLLSHLALLRSSADRPSRGSPLAAPAPAPSPGGPVECDMATELAAAVSAARREREELEVRLQQAAQMLM
uniref:Uncharacterized protein n=1 Tax=Emiliania huxleyi TaxID=2903 RepID=A0A7S3SNS0_EMIHU